MKNEMITLNSPSINRHHLMVFIKNAMFVVLNNIMYTLELAAI